MKGHVTVQFTREAAQSQIEQALAQHKYEQVFSDSKDPELNRLYVLEVKSGEEPAVVKELKEKYSSIVKYAHQPPIRRLA